MKKKFKIEVDCANCALKVEEAIKKVSGVNDASINFVMQKLTVDADDSRFDEIMKEVLKAGKKVESDFVIEM